MWKPKTQKKPAKNQPKTPTECTDDEENELQIRSFPPANTSRAASSREYDSHRNQTQDDASPVLLSTDSPSTDHRDPIYYAPETPKSQREHIQSRDLDLGCHKITQASCLIVNLL